MQRNHKRSADQLGANAACRTYKLKPKRNSMNNGSYDDNRIAQAFKLPPAKWLTKDKHTSELLFVFILSSVTGVPLSVSIPVMAVVSVAYTALVSIHQFRSNWKRLARMHVYVALRNVQKRSHGFQKLIEWLI